MERLANALTDRIYRNESELSIEVYQYGLQVALEMLAVVFTCCCIAIYLDMKIECCFCLSIFSVLRSYAGGLHFTGFIKCFFCSAMIITGILLFVNTYSIPSTAICVLMVIFTIAFSILEPVNSRNKEVTNEESGYYKKKLRMVMVFLSLLSLVMLIAGWSRYANLIVVTTMITFVLVLIGRWKER